MKFATDTITEFCGTDDSADYASIERKMVKFQGVIYQKTENFSRYWHSADRAHMLSMGSVREAAADRIAKHRGNLDAARAAIDADIADALKMPARATQEERSEYHMNAALLGDERAMLDLFDISDHPSPGAALSTLRPVRAVTCDWCGSQFEARDTRAKYCPSPATCRNSAKHQAARDARLTTAPADPAQKPRSDRSAPPPPQ